MVPTAFHSMFQQSNSSKIHTPLDPLSFCKLVVPHLTSSPLGCDFLSQYCYINTISTEFLSPVVCIISAISPYKSGALSFHLFQCCSNFVNPDAICWSFCNLRKADYYSLWGYPAYHVCHLHCINSSSTCSMLDTLAVTYNGVRWPLYWTFVTYMPDHPLRCKVRSHCSCLYTGRITTWL